MIKSRYGLIVLLALLIVYWPIFNFQPLGANDFPTITNTTLKSYFNLPQTWTNYGAGGLGYYSIAQIWLWPFLLITGVLANLGLNLMVIQRLVYFIPILGLGIISAEWLGRKLQLSPLSSAVLAVFFLTNTYLIGLIDGGQLSIALAYAWIPCCYLITVEAWQKPLKIKLLAALFWSALAVLEIRFLVLLGFLVSARFIFDLITLRSAQLIKNGCMTAIIIGLSLTLLNSYWLLPIIAFPPPSQLISSLTQTSFTSFATLGHGLLFITPHWYQNSFGLISTLRLEFLVIPLLVLLSPILQSRHRQIGFYLLIWICSIFLIKGANPPIAGLYPWLFEHFPSFNLFRDSTKFFVLTALSASILIAFTSQSLTTRLKSRFLTQMIPISIITLFVILASPAWLLQMSGIFSNQPNRTTFKQISQLLNQDSDYSRVLWIPTTSSLANADIRHPILEALLLTESRPFAISRVGNYELLNYLREAPYINQLLDVMGVKYLVYPAVDHQKVSGDEASYYVKFFDQLRQLPWLSQPNPTLPVFQTTQHQNRLFLANQWWVVGSDDLYAQATTSASLQLKDNAFIFVEENPQLSQQLFNSTNPNIILNHKTILDLTALLIPSGELITPATDLTTTPNQSNWWRPKNLLDWKDFLSQKYRLYNQDFDLNVGLAIAEGTTLAQIKHHRLQTNRLLLARVLESSQGGQLNFHQGNQPIGQLNTTSSVTNLRWQIVGYLNSSQPLSIQTTGTLNVINALAAVNPMDWDNYLSQTKQLSQNIKPYQPASIPAKLTTELKFTRLSPTQYQVEIYDLSRPTMLVLGESFSPLWQLNQQPALPVYSILNGFLITQDGTYDLVFAPQRLVTPGLIISIFSAILLIGLTIYLLRRP